MVIEVGRSPGGHQVHDAGGQLVLQGEERRAEVRQGHEAEGLHREDPRGLHQEALQQRQAHQAGLLAGLCCIHCLVFGGLFD